MSGVVAMGLGSLARWLVTAVVMGVPLGWVMVRVVVTLVGGGVSGLARWLVMSLPLSGVVGMVMGGVMSKVQV